MVCSDISLSAAEGTADEINHHGGKRSLSNVTSPVPTMSATWRRRRNRGSAALRLVINNAGVVAGGHPIGERLSMTGRGRLESISGGVIHGCHVFVPILREAGFGGIINVASASAFGATPNLPVYSVSKAAVLALSTTLSTEVSGTGVRVTAVCPSFVKTDIMDRGRLTAESAEQGRKLMKRTGIPPERVARKRLRRPLLHPATGREVHLAVAAPGSYVLGARHRRSLPREHWAQ